MAPTRVWYFGSDALSLRLLQRVHGKRQALGIDDAITVVTPPDRAQGRSKQILPCVLKRGALELGLRTIDAPQVAPRPLDSAWPDSLFLAPPSDKSLAIVFSFGYFMPPRLIDAFGMCVNLHPSLLPQYRGASPIQHALLNHDALTGASLITLHPKRFDCGQVLRQASLPLLQTDTYTGVSESLVDLGGDLLEDLLLNPNRSPPPLPPLVKHERAIQLAPKLDRNKLMMVDFNSPEDSNVWGKFRALEQVKCVMRARGGVKVSLLDMFLPAGSGGGGPPPELDAARPGDVWFGGLENKDGGGALWIRNSTSASIPLLGVRKLQVEGKRVVSAAEFFNGHLAKLQQPGSPPLGVVPQVFA